MKRILAGSLMVLLVGLVASPAMAQMRSWDNMDWWTQNGSGPTPVKDAYRSGYWWWPEDPGINGDDQTLWGNRGLVYGKFDFALPQPPDPTSPTPAPTSTPEPPTPAEEPTPPAPESPAPAEEEPTPEPQAARPEPPVAPPPEAEEPVPVPVPERNVPVLANVLFEFDQSVVSDTGHAEIAKVVGMLEQYSDDTLTIEGHTCDINRSGETDYNMKLGQRRADAVMAALVENGISADRVSAKSLGEGQPAVPNTTEENRGLNRRVVFVYSISD